MDRETIYGQILAKANHYQAVPDTASGGSRIIIDEAYRAYQRTFLEQCKVYRNRHIDKPFILICHVWFRTSASDLDNAQKSLLDLLQDVGAIENDSLCVELHAVKHIDPINPRIEFGIVDLEPRLF